MPSLLPTMNHFIRILAGNFGLVILPLACCTKKINSSAEFLWFIWYKI
jgi:hypothetical protein